MRLPTQCDIKMHLHMRTAPHTHRAECYAVERSSGALTHRWGMKHVSCMNFDLWHLVNKQHVYM